MKKSLFFFAAAALALTACSNDDATQQAQATAAPQAVAFDTYTSGTTRAGLERLMTTTTLQKAKDDGGGFGVFGFFTDNDVYTSTATPNFMWNQGVFWDGTAMGWEYAPLKYWPNETGQDSQNIDGGAAVSEGGRVDKLSFFAYAPYVKNQASTYDGKLDGVTYNSSDEPEAGIGAQRGIVKIESNSKAGDPRVMYRVSQDPSKTVDLLWGVAPAGDLTYETVKNKQVFTVSEGMPLLNLIKPNKDQKMKFLFQHALSRITLSVVGAFDQIAPGGKKDANTKILVKEVKIYESVANSVKIEGWLNLNNTTPNVAKWENTTGDDYTSTPLFAITGDDIHHEIKLDADNADFASQPDGVTTAEHAVFEDAEDFFAVIPSGPTNLIVEITYYVQTKDDQLAVVGSVDGSRVENQIKKAVTVDFKNGKSYNLKLILGLTSVKLDAEVADWKVAGDSEVNLPRNND